MSDVAGTPPAEAAGEAAEPRGFRFPSSLTVLLLVTVLVWLTAFLIPAGTYERDEEGAPIPGSYREVAAPQSFGERVGDLFLAPINGLYGLQHPHSRAVLPFGVGSLFGAAGVFLFVLAVGAFMTMVLATGALDVAIGRLAYAVRDRPWLVIVAVMVLFSLLGTAMGFAEETLGFYALLMPLMLTLGYDRLAATAMIILGAAVGSMASTVNPFSIGVASEFAGVSLGEGIGLRFLLWIVLTAVTIAYVLRYAQRVKNDPSRSLVGIGAEDLATAAQEQAAGDQSLTGRQKLVLAITAFTFALLVFSVIPWDSIIGFELADPETHKTLQNDFWWNLAWWFPELTALFIVGAVVVGLVAGFGEREISSNITRGAADFLGAGLAVVLARGVTVILNNTQTIDTVLSWMEGAVSGASASVFALLVLAVNMGIGFVIPSSSGHATLAMPLLAPLGDFAGVSRELVVTCWVIGAGLIRFITPTSAVIMAGLALGKVGYDRWVRFVVPLMAIEFVIAGAILALAALLE